MFQRNQEVTDNELVDPPVESLTTKFSNAGCGYTAPDALGTKTSAQGFNSPSLCGKQLVGSEIFSSVGSEPL